MLTMNPIIVDTSNRKINKQRIAHINRMYRSLDAATFFTDLLTEALIFALPC